MTARLVILIVCGAVLLGGFATFIHGQRREAAQSERAKQEKENARFLVNARKGAVSFDTCDTAGGLFDFAKSTCKLP